MPRQESKPNQVLGEVADLMGVTRFEVKWALVVAAVVATVGAARKVLDAIAQMEMEHPSGSLRR